METRATGKLIIANGKFIRNGVEEKPEHGNAEQIYVLRKHERIMEQFENGIEVKPSYDHIITASVSFTCQCGIRLYHEIDELEEEDVDYFVDTLVHCRECGQAYTFEINDDKKLVVKPSQN